MGWIIMSVLLAGAFYFWMISHKTDDEVVAWCRFLVSCFLLLLSAFYAAAMLAQWMAT